MKIGRNDKCPCGSGRKYKKCHLGKPLFTPPNPFSERTIKERNNILVNVIADIFEFEEGKVWQDIKSNITADRVKELYRVFATLWPPQTDLISLLPKPDSTLRGLYIGDTKPQLILQNIVRYSLYTDEILVVNPFLNPNIMVAEHNPIVHPEAYRQDTLELIYFVVALAPWIQAGIVNLIPDPMDFDYKLRKDIYGRAQQRFVTEEKDFEEKYKEEFQDEAKEEFKKMFLKFPAEYHARKIKEMKPNATEAEIQKTVEYIQQTRARDPLILDETLTQEGEMKIKRMGANLELGLFLGQLTGSYLYTNRKFQWDEIMTATQPGDEEADVWSPLTHAFQSLDFTFLNHVDPKFAYNLKEEGRLQGFRNYLRRVWKEIEQQSSPSAMNKSARIFSDELHEQYAITKEEWAQIDKSILQRLAKGSTLSAILAPLITGSLTWQAPAAGFCLSAVTTLLAARADRKKFKANVPLAVFLDLEKKNKLLK